MSRECRTGMLKIDHKIITRAVWWMLKEPDTQVRRKNIREHLKAYMGERPSEEILRHSCGVRKNLNHLVLYCREFIPISFGHRILRNIFDQMMLIDYVHSSNIWRKITKLLLVVSS